MSQEATKRPSDEVDETQLDLAADETRLDLAADETRLDLAADEGAAYQESLRYMVEDIDIETGSE